MDNQTKETVAGLIRYLISLTGMYLVANGSITSADLTTVAGGGEALISFLMMVGPPMYWALRKRIRAWFGK